MTSTNNSVQVNRADRFAEAVSLVFHPFIVIIPTMVIAILQQGNTLWQALFWTALAVCVVILPLVFLIYSGVRSGRYSDPSVSIREQRHILYIAAGIFMVLLLAILVLGKAPLILLACMVSAILTTLVGYVINARFTKLSLHSIGMAGCATVLILTVPVLGLAMAFFTPLVGWARIRLRHHTPLQILVGWMDAVFSVLLIFHMFHLLSWQF
jgi:membrane-associated phospholipid phosphatase